jgi:hypothetical protein
MPIRTPKPDHTPMILELPPELPPPEPVEPVLQDTPTQPYPDTEPLDHAAVEAALWHAEGNVHVAATLLNTRPARVAYLINRLPNLQTARRLASELLLDKAELILHDALDDQADTARQDNAARFILEKGGRSRGWSKDGGGALNLAFDPQTPSQGQIAIRWQIDE